MGVSIAPSTLFFTGLLLILLANDSDGVKCYVCSWSPYDNTNDTCRPDYFNPDHTLIHECDKGCETVIMRDHNGEMEMFYRNCYTKSDNDYTYSKKNTRLNEEEVYKCNFKLCNQAVTIQTVSSVIVVMTAVIVSVYHRLL